MARYTSDSDVRDRFVVPALGEYVEDFDVDGIVSAVILGADSDGLGTFLVVDEDPVRFWVTVEDFAL